MTIFFCVHFFLFGTWKKNAFIPIWIYIKFYKHTDPFVHVHMYMYTCILNFLHFSLLPKRYRTLSRECYHFCTEQERQINYFSGEDIQAIKLLKAI